MMRRSGGTTPPPWFWEGNIQATVIERLVAVGWTVIRQANTATREPGKDIELQREDVTLWVTVKGFPNGTPRTHPNTQARHWFTAAIFDVILWREADQDTRIAVALPAMPTYRRQATRTTWFQRTADFSYLWVDEIALVSEECGTDAMSSLLEPTASGR
ncbi:MAG: hypothetical protein AVDCRST_MAG70-1799 [uncultured Thermomicrobiales bacterium]|uniref:Uncharacterized protein n=1 Tax=uncultured Thermomicrobiales bacterium TaxID=1645740 RepID=A0A6J4UXL7_9BACT|nr:MAG: hypothetical protein AVDCRST_MAG70-1799 [uncultured Thermomicrobiales bacterium]